MKDVHGTIGALRSKTAALEGALAAQQQQGEAAAARSWEKQRDTLLQVRPASWEKQRDTLLQVRPASWEKQRDTLLQVRPASPPLRDVEWSGTPTGR
jgi:hypothetical protein